MVIMSACHAIIEMVSWGTFHGPDKGFSHCIVLV
jgi:hypothetical protein